jgi:hypothetical protein
MEDEVDERLHDSEAIISAWTQMGSQVLYGDRIGIWIGWATRTR